MLEGLPLAFVNACMELRQRLEEELQRNKNYKGREFISAGALSKLVTFETIHDALERSGILVARDLIEIIVSEAPRIFSILVLISREYHIFSFLDSRLHDDKLPIEESNVPSFETEHDRRRFFVLQRSFPPVFEKHRHLEVSEMVALPILEHSYVANGSFGMVYKVKIAEGHLPDSSSNVVALKRVLKDEHESWKTIMREVETLRKREHPNIIPLLASFILNGVESGYETKSLNLIFPYAEMNMEAWMDLQQTPEYLPCWDSEGRRRYLYQSMYSLVSALSFLHRELDGMITSHHDLKPKNILVLGDTLKLCDFGRSHLIPLAQGSETQGPRGTYTYHPPEYWNDDGSRASRSHGRAFDVWSMGCILTEMATLVVYGWDKKREVRRFRERRSASPSHRKLKKREEEEKQDDSFHNHIDEVKRWISELEARDGSRLLNKCLRIAEAMLNHVPDERLYSWEAELDMFDELHPDNPRVVLLEKGALCVQPPGLKASTGVQTPLHRATLRENLDRVNQLLQAGWSADARDGSGLSPIQIAEQSGNRLLQHQLLQGIKNEPTVRDKPFNESNQSSPDELAILTVSIKRGLTSEVLAILTRSMSRQDLLRQRDKNGLTPLHCAARFATYPTIDILLSHVEDLQETLWVKDGFGNTPLHHASECATGDVISRLFQSCSNKEQWVWEKGSNGKLPLHWAAQGGNKSAAEVLLRLAPDPSRMLTEEDDGGNTPLRLAIKYNRAEVEELLRNFKRS